MLSDEELVERVQRYYDGAAMRVLLERVYPEVRDIVAVRAGHRLRTPDLEDAQQDAGFDDVVQAIFDFRCRAEGGGSFRRFLRYRLRSRTDNRVRDSRSKKGVCSDLLVEEQLNHQVERSHIEEMYNVWSASRLGDPALYAERCEEAARLQRVIGRLDSRYRILCQYIEDGLTFQEMAERFGVTVVTIRHWRNDVGQILRHWDRSARRWRCCGAVCSIRP